MTVHRIDDGAAVPVSAKVGREGARFFGSNIAGDAEVYFVASWTTAVIQRVSATNLNAPAVKVFDAKPFGMHDCHVLGVWVTRRLLIVACDETLVVLDRAQNHTLLGSAWLGGNYSHWATEPPRAVF